MTENSFKNKIKNLPPALWWAVGYAVMLICSLAVVYYWCVFYSYAQISKERLSLIAVLFASVAYAMVFVICRFVKTIELKAFICILLCGLLFCFATPPLQTPDEALHYARSYSISSGHFDFNADRAYPNDVNTLFQHFNYAFANSQNGHPIKDGRDITFAFEDYNSALALGKQAPIQKEPLSFMIIPYLPQAFGMLIGRLLGFTALGVLYFGRALNLFIYAVLCYFAISNCKRYKPVFITIALLPLSLFISASLNYDALLLGLALFTASYYCRDEITDKSLVIFYVAVALMSAVKLNYILFAIIPLLLPKHAWNSRLKKWQALSFGILTCCAFVFAFSVYSKLFTFNYPNIGRMLGDEDVDQMRQLVFILSNIPRFCAITVGTLYEQCLFFFNSGQFGLLDVNIPLVSAGSAGIMIVSAALSVHEKSSLSLKSSAGLFCVTMAYTASVLAALYITYTPVGMARIAGLQPRYFVPAFLMLMILLSALLSHVMELNLKGAKNANLLTLGLCGAFAVISALLILQHYYVGPVYITK